MFLCIFLVLVYEQYIQEQPYFKYIQHKTNLKREIIRFREIIKIFCYNKFSYKKKLVSLKKIFIFFWYGLKKFYILKVTKIYLSEIFFLIKYTIWARMWYLLISLGHVFCFQKKKKMNKS